MLRRQCQDTLFTFHQKTQKNMPLEDFFARFLRVEISSGKLCVPSFARSAIGRSSKHNLYSATHGTENRRLFRIYQIDVHPFAQTLVNIHSFETELCGYVQKWRHTISPIEAEQRPRAQDLQQGMSMAWISILFALLACGAQFCNEATSMRQEQSSLYGK